MSTPHEALGGPGGTPPGRTRCPRRPGWCAARRRRATSSRSLAAWGSGVLPLDVPPRLRTGSGHRPGLPGQEPAQLAAHLESVGCQPDRRFNNLNGDRQMYFIAPSGRPIDVMVDRLSMCHTLEFKVSFDSPSMTLNPADLLLSKLQVVELNAKDAHDIFHLLSGLRVGRDSARPSIDPTGSARCSRPTGAGGGR